MTPKTLIMSIVFVAALVMGAHPTQAQPSESAPETGEIKQQHILIEGDLLEGQAVRESGIVVNVGPRIGFGRQATLKKAFGRELQESLEDDALH